MRKGKILRRASVFMGVVGISFAFAAVAFADAPNPNSITPSAVRNPDNTITVTVQGTWNWDRDDCGEEEDGRWVGWAADWNDPNQPGVVMDGEDVEMGAATANGLNPADNAVHTNGICDEDNPVDPTGSAGHWGPLSHTYAANTTEISVCVVMYDVKVEEEETEDVAAQAFVPKDDKQLIAASGEGNDDYNKDNSLQDPNGDDDPTCIEADIPVPPPNVAPETVTQPQPLAFTGSSNGPLLAAGLGLLALGGISVYTAKRRRPTADLQG